MGPGLGPCFLLRRTLHEICTRKMDMSRAKFGQILDNFQAMSNISGNGAGQGWARARARAGPGLGQGRGRAGPGPIIGPMKEGPKMTQNCGAPF